MYFETNFNSLGFLLVIRLQSWILCLVAFSHDMNTHVTTGIILNAVEKDAERIRKTLRRHNSLIGQPLLLPTILLNISVKGSIKGLLITRAKLDSIEDETQQHTWVEVIANRHKDDPEDVGTESLMKVAHGSKIGVAINQRKIKVISSVASLLQQTCTDFHDGTLEGYEIEEWIDYLNSQAQMLVTDIEYSWLRIENQISAVRAPVIFAPHQRPWPETDGLENTSRSMLSLPSRTALQLGG